MGSGIAVVLGSDGYDTKFGSVPASTFGIRTPFDVPDRNFLAIDLSGGSAQMNGTVAYPKEFGVRADDTR